METGRTDQDERKNTRIEEASDPKSSTHVFNIWLLTEKHLNISLKEVFEYLKISQNSNTSSQHTLAVQQSLEV